MFIRNRSINDTGTLWIRQFPVCIRYALGFRLSFNVETPNQLNVSTFKIMYNSKPHRCNNILVNRRQDMHVHVMWQIFRTKHNNIQVYKA